MKWTINSITLQHIGKNKLKIVSLVLIMMMLVGIIFPKPILTHLKILLFISEEFPQIPVKPLSLLSKTPKHTVVEFDSQNGKVVADLYLPQSDNKSKSAIIPAVGVRMQEKDKILIRQFSEALARLGYIVLWPRLERLEKGEALPEKPQTFIEAFKFLANLQQIDSERITFAGFSVGSSTALVAATDPQISHKVHGLIFFGGAFDLLEYLKSLASKSYKVNGSQVEWRVADDARNHAKGLLLTEGIEEMVNVFEYSDPMIIDEVIENAPKEEREKLNRFNPREVISQFRTRTFILHDKSDVYVPYLESVKLYQALPKSQVGAFVITDLFDHVQPNRPINLGELARLYGFLYKVFLYL